MRNINIYHEEKKKFKHLPNSAGYRIISRKKDVFNGKEVLLMEVDYASLGMFSHRIFTEYNMQIGADQMISIKICATWKKKTFTSYDLSPAGVGNRKSKVEENVAKIKEEFLFLMNAFNL